MDSSGALRPVQVIESTVYAAMVQGSKGEHWMLGTSKCKSVPAEMKMRLWDQFDIQRIRMYFLLKDTIDKKEQLILQFQRQPYSKG